MDDLPLGVAGGSGEAVEDDESSSIDDGPGGGGCATVVAEEFAGGGAVCGAVDAVEVVAVGVGDVSGVGVTGAAGDFGGEEEGDDRDAVGIGSTVVVEVRGNVGPNLSRFGFTGTSPRGEEHEDDDFSFVVGEAGGLEVSAVEEGEILIRRDAGGWRLGGGEGGGAEEEEEFFHLC